MKGVLKKRRLEELRKSLPWSVGLLLLQILVSWMLYIRVEAIVFDAYLEIIVPLSVISHLILFGTYIMRADRMLVISLLFLFHLGVVLQINLVDVDALEKGLAAEKVVEQEIIATEDGVVEDGAVQEEVVENPVKTILTNNIVVIVGALLCTIVFCFMYHFVDLQLLQKLMIVATAGMFLLLILFCTGAHGVKAWLSLGGFRFQVTELIKLSSLLYLCLLYADVFWTTGQKLCRVGCFLGGITLGFLVINELGTVIIIWVVALVLTFMALDLSDFLMLAGALFAMVLLVVLVVTKLNLGYMAGTKNALTTLGFEIFQKVYHRFQLVYDLDSLDPYGTAYQSVIARKAIQLGNFWGTSEHNLKIPVAQSEYIMVYACLKYGLFLVLLVSMVYVGVILRGNRIAERQKEDAFSYIGIACAYSLGIQSLLTILGTCGLLPLSGLPIAFLSDGFSMQFISFISMFLLVYTSSKCSGVYETARGRRMLGWVKGIIPHIAKF